MHPLSIIAIISIAFVGIVVAVKYMQRWKRVHNALDQEIGIPKHHAKFKYKYLTPAGIKVWSVVEVPAQALQAIDRGISDMLVRYRAIKPDWKNATQIHEYKVLFVEPDGVSAESEPGAPFIYHRSGGPTAGTVIGCSPDSACEPYVYLVLPHQEKQKWNFLNYLSNSAFHEGEHYFEWHNCWGVFLHFAHRGDVHPHVDNMPDINFDCSKNGGVVK